MQSAPRRLPVFLALGEMSWYLCAALLGAGEGKKPGGRMFFQPPPVVTVWRFVVCAENENRVFLSLDIYPFNNESIKEAICVI